MKIRNLLILLILCLTSFQMFAAGPIIQNEGIVSFNANPQATPTTGYYIHHAQSADCNGVLTKYDAGPNTNALLTDIGIPEGQNCIRISAYKGSFETTTSDAFAFEFIQSGNPPTATIISTRN